MVTCIRYQPSLLVIFPAVLLFFSVLKLDVVSIKELRMRIVYFTITTFPLWSYIDYGRMDPISITASIIAVLGAGGTVAKGLNRIRRLNNAPEILLQLNNEVVDIHLVIRSVDELAQQWSQQPSTSERQRELVHAALSRTKDTVLELERLIAYILTKETDTGAKVDRLAWIMNMERIREMKNKIRAARDNLNSIWAMLSNR